MQMHARAVFFVIFGVFLCDMVSRATMCVFAVGLVYGQTKEKVAPKEAYLDGKVVSESTGAPLRRAHVTLHPVTAGGSSISVDGDDNGTFEIREIPPGQYTLAAERDGYLSSAIFRRGALRMPPVFSLSSGQHLSGLTFLLRPWAVISGRIKYDDGETAAGARVAVYRDYHARGRHGYNQVASAATDDRGEYRIYGLAPGSYFVSASTARSLPVRGLVRQARVDSAGNPLAEYGYATTFYPQTTKLSEAVAVHLDSGREESGLDIFLSTVRKLSIQVTVTSGLSGKALSNADLTVSPVDASGAPGPVMNVSINRDLKSNSLTIVGVPPGSYLLEANASEESTVLRGRALVTASEFDISSVEIVAEARRSLHGTVILQEGGSGLDASKLRIAMEPRSQAGALVDAGIDRESKFEVNVDPTEVYDLYVNNLPDDSYVAGVRVNGADALENGIAGGETSAYTPFQVLLDSRGGRVAGRVFGPDGTVWSGATVMLIPDPPDKRWQAYRSGSADEYGQFTLHGVPPGKYILVAWLDDAPCEVADGTALDGCRAVGMALSLEQGDSPNVELDMKSPRR